MCELVCNLIYALLTQQLKQHGAEQERQEEEDVGAADAEDAEVGVITAEDAEVGGAEVYQL